TEGKNQNIYTTFFHSRDISEGKIVLFVYIKSLDHNSVNQITMGVPNKSFLMELFSAIALPHCTDKTINPKNPKKKGSI
ncbi:hypothetical protein CEE39_05090, partial [bacterium (candidate division B38) B3_B38]